MAELYKNFQGHLWYQKEDNIYTIGINEDALDEIDGISSVDLPTDGEVVEADVVLGSIDTDNGPLDIYSPVAGTIVEINTTVGEDPTLIQDDPYDAWLFKVESDEELSDDEDEDEEDEDEDDEDDDLDEDDEEFEEDEE